MIVFAYFVDLFDDVAVAFDVICGGNEDVVHVYKEVLPGVRFGRVRNTLTIARTKVAGAFRSPKFITIGSYCPSGVVNAAFSWSPL